MRFRSATPAGRSRAQLKISLGTCLILFGNDPQEKMPLTLKTSRARESLGALCLKAAFRS
jgi:hypothetical protein